MWLMFALNLSSTKGHKIYTKFMNLLGLAFKDSFCSINYNNPLFKLLTKKWQRERFVTKKMIYNRIYTRILRKLLL